MNLAELVKKHPDKKYRRNWWTGEDYIYYNGNYWLEQDGDYESGCTIVLNEFMCSDWELYTEPLNITKDDIFKEVRLKNGNIETIVGFDVREGKKYPVLVTSPDFIRSITAGGIHDVDCVSEFDIIEIL